MKHPEARIVDILTTEYSDFLEYCALADKKLAGEISSIDYIAFRAQFDVPQSVVSSIHNLLENYSPNEGEVVALKIAVNNDDDAKDHMGVDAKIVDDMIAVSEENEKNGANIEYAKNNEEDISLSRDETIYLTEDPDKPERDQNVDSTLAQIMGVKDPSVYDDVKLLALEFNVRASNILSNAKCYTLGALLRYTVLDLHNLSGLGKGTFDNILKVLSDYFEKRKRCAEGLNDRGIKQYLPNSKALETQVQNMLEGNAYTTENFSEDELKYFQKCVEARDLLGSEICLLAKNGDIAFIYIYLLLKQYGLYATYIVKMKTELSLLSQEMLGQLVNPYGEAYCQSVLTTYDGETFRKKQMDQEAYSVLSDRNLVIGLLLDKIQCKVHSRAGLEECLKFIKWLGNDFLQIIHNNITGWLNQKDERGVDVLKLRADGKTLEQIGATMNVTRERVRQLEKKVCSWIVRQYYFSQYDIVLVLNAIQGGNSFLPETGVQELLCEEDAKIFWYLVSRGELDCQAYHYDKDINAILIGSTSKTINVAKFTEKLPNGFLINDLDRILHEICGDDKQKRELLLQEVKSKYKIYGQYMHRGKLFAIEICDYILENRFPNGYKIADADYEKQFRYHMQDLFGEVKCLPSGRSIDSTISRVGMLFDRGKYIHPSRIHIEQDTIDKVNAYIANSTRTALTYGEIFEATADILRGTEIINKYVLQGALHLYGCPYIARRDYVTKETTQNIAIEVTQFIKEQGVVHKSVLMTEFSFSDARIGQVLDRCPEIIAIDAGYYMYANDLIISDEEVRAIRKYIISVCARAPVSTRAMLDDFNLKFTDFVVENGIYNQGKLFGILQYLFKEEFHFSRPYISMNDVKSMDTKSVLLTHMEGVQSIEIDDLNDLCRSVGIHFTTTFNMIVAIQPEYVRINDITLMRRDIAGITEDVLIKTKEIISEEIETYQYCSVKKITDFSWYPEINVEWTPYLVESIMNGMGNGFPSVYIPKGVSAYPSTIFLGEEYAEDDYQSFIIRLLNEEHWRDPFTKREQVLDWLVEKGLCLEKLPRFLEDDKHLYTDENGQFRIE